MSDTPESNRPLTGDDVKLLKAGDVLQPLDGRRGFSFVDRNRVLFLRAAEQTPELIYTDIAGPVMADRFVFVSRPTQPEPERDGGAFDQSAFDRKMVVAIADHLRDHPAAPYSGRQCEEMVQSLLSLLSTAERQRDEAMANLLKVQNAAKTLHHCRDTELQHLRENATFDHRLRAEHESLMARDSMMTDLLETAERQRDEAVRALERIAHPEYGIGFRRLTGIARQALQSIGSGDEARALNEGG